MFLALLSWLGVLFLGIALFFCLWFQYHIDAFVYLLNSRDKKWSRAPDPEAMKRQHGLTPIATKRLYFLRHGESTWNEVFNRSKALFLVNLLKGMIGEVALIFKHKDSLFYDSPLCPTGFAQAESVQEFLKENSDNRHVDILNNQSGLLLVCSNLRRCISTALVAFQKRLESNEERVLIHSSLQEITYNPDGLSITPADASPVASTFDLKNKAHDMNKMYSRHTNPAANAGNKGITSNGLKRLNEFNTWLFQQPQETVAISGHSLWFKSYFSEFLPHTHVHVSKKKKLKNCAIVALAVDQYQAPNGEKFVMIQPDSITEVFLGFKK